MNTIRGDVLRERGAANRYSIDDTNVENCNGLPKMFGHRQVQSIQTY